METFSSCTTDGSEYHYILPVGLEFLKDAEFSFGEVANINYMINVFIAQKIKI